MTEHFDFLNETVRILFVDDDEEDYMLVRDLLGTIRDMSIQVDWESDYGKALQRLLSNQDDVCLLDYYLGERNGLDLLKAALAGGCQAAFVMLTGRGNRQIDLEAMRIGANFYVDKNQIDAFDLERAIRYSLEHSRILRTIQEFNDQLEAANKELEAFSYSISHDLRAPLRAITGFSKIVLEQYGTLLPTEGQDYLQRVSENAVYMAVLIEDLLRFSRMSREPLNLQTVSVEEIVRLVLDDLHGEQEGRQIEITIGDLPSCQGDPILLKQVYFNLVSNALKYTRKCEIAQVEIGCKGVNSESIYYVKDNGAGFNMNHADKLFGVFQRLHSAADYEGTGVGLAIVQRIIHRHGGRIWAEAAVDQGAAFYFTLENPPH